MDTEVKQLHSQAKSLFAKFERGQGTDLVSEAIVLDRKALDLCPSGHPERWVSLGWLRHHLLYRYRQLGAARDIEEAISLAREALDLCPGAHPDRPWSLNNLAVDLSTRYNQFGATTDLDEAIVYGQEALDLSPTGHPLRPSSLNNVALCLSTRYSQSGTAADLDEAILLGREAVNICSVGHPLRSTSLNNAAADLSTRYRWVGEIADLDAAITLVREALELFPQGHPERSRCLNNIASYLSTRYKRLGEMADLDRAIVLGQQALDLCPRGHPERSMSLNTLSLSLSNRYNRLGAMADLDTAIAFGREALDLLPRGHPGRSSSLDNLALALSTRYNQLGTIADLDEAIVLGWEALDLCPRGHPSRSSPLNNAAIYLFARYNQLRTMADLNEAIALGREALELLPQGHPDRSRCLNNVALYLSTRYEQLGSAVDIDEAIVFGREALRFCPRGHPDRSMRLNNIALHLSARYNQRGETTDLDEAMALGREALDLRPRGHPLRPTSLDNVARYLFTRYEELGEIADLDEAIALRREALQLRPVGHPNRSSSLDHLARYLRTHFVQTNQMKDQEALFDLYSELTNIPQMVSSADLFAAQEWANVAEDFHHPTTLLAYQTSLLLLVRHLTTLPSLPQHLPILKQLTSSLAVDAFSACLRNRSPENAVELLEQGRGVFWNQISRLRSPLDDVIASGTAGKTLAAEFGRVSSLIREAIRSPGADQHDRLCHLNLEMQEVVIKIRHLPGLSRFLLPSLFSDLKRAASAGPIVIVNASKYGCDALVVFIDQDPVHIPLKITQVRVRNLSSELRSLTLLAKKMDMRREFGRFLRDLWDEVVSPVVDFLRSTHPARSRIWWCPTAEFSLLPLHAAGPYRKGQQNLSHLYISSYTSTLTALIRARRRYPSDSATKGKHFLAIGQANAVGESELASVRGELAIVGQRVSSLASFTRIEGAESSISRVSEELAKSEWVHFACHGLPNRRLPFDSAFALHDGHFTIQHIMQCELENPEFAYLSACHTTVGDEESPDEVIHLASAMQFAGYRSVIGTMWAVDDGETAKITSSFYGSMTDESGRLDHTRAAYALNKTMTTLAGIPLDQRILYIHIGT